MPSASLEADGLAAARGIGPAADGLVVSRLAPVASLVDTAGTVLAVGRCFFAVSATADARRHPVHARGIAARDVDAEARGWWPQRCDAGTVRQDFADGPPEAWAASLRAVAGSLRRPCGLRERRGRPLVAACRSGWPAFAGLRNARPVRGLRGCRRREALDRSPRVPRRARHDAHVAAFPGERAGVVERTPVPGRPFSPSPVSPLSVTRTGNPVQRCLRNGGLWYAGNCGENDGGAQGVRGGPPRSVREGRKGARTRYARRAKHPCIAGRARCSLFVASLCEWRLSTHRRGRGTRRVVLSHVELSAHGRRVRCGEAERANVRRRGGGRVKPAE